jgi:hypothetical protein
MFARGLSSTFQLDDAPLMIDLRMQLRRSSFPSEDALPCCPFGHEEVPCLHRHGNYERYSGPEGDLKIKIFRFLCKFAGKTVSVLDDDLLPYRSVPVSCVEGDFDQRADPCAAAAESGRSEVRSEVVQGCLERAWRRFSDESRRLSLAGFFGQRIVLTSTAGELWQAIRQTAGKLPDILLQLASRGKSLLGDYRCLRPD